MSDDRAVTFERLDAAYREAVASACVPGAAWGVVLDGRLVHSGGAGSRDTAGSPDTAGSGDGAVPDERTVFRIASMTKSFTAATVLGLRDEGLLRLDDPVAVHVPEASAIHGPTLDSPAITVRHLLSMDAGFATDDAWADRHLDLTPGDLDEILGRGVTFAAAPGTALEYSNLGYALLGRIVENVTGSSCRDVIDDRLLRPLGMTDTVWDVPSDGRRIAVGHRLLDGLAVGDGEPLGHGAFGPMGGLWSTVADLARWVAFLLDAFPPRDDADEGPLRRSTRREMQRVWRSTPVTIDRAEPEHPRLTPAGYGAGLFLLDDEQVGPCVAHSGGLPGFGSNMFWMPDRRLGVVSLGNLRYAPMGTMNRKVLHALAGEGLLDGLAPAAAHPVSAPLADAMARLVALVNAWDDDRARELFADNVELDDDLGRRASDAAALVERCGPLTVQSVRATRATSATADLAGERGTTQVRIELNPAVPPRVQWYSLTGSDDH